MTSEQIESIRYVTPPQLAVVERVIADIITVVQNCEDGTSLEKVIRPVLIHRFVEREQEVREKTVQQIKDALIETPIEKWRGTIMEQIEYIFEILDRAKTPKEQ